VSDRDDVWAAVTGVYEAFLAGDGAAIDAALAPDATLWDAFHEPLLRGKAERDARPAQDGPPPSDLRAHDELIDVWGDTALVRHLLTVVYPDGSEQRVRNTAVWRRGDERWLCVHNHEDLRP
jgi:ketosteroid isomerase-like protein